MLKIFLKQCLIELSIDSIANSIQKNINQLKPKKYTLETIYHKKCVVKIIRFIHNNKKYTKAAIFPPDREIDCENKAIEIMINVDTMSLLYIDSVYVNYQSDTIISKIYYQLLDENNVTHG
jgi:hypothetical protein